MTLVRIQSDRDLIEARAQARALAREHGFDLFRVSSVVTIVSELARNIVAYVGEGEIEVRWSPETSCILIDARDHGEGIENVAAALQDGFSTSGGLGIGLPGVRRLADDFHIASSPGKGTVVKVAVCQEHHRHVTRRVRPDPLVA